MLNSLVLPWSLVVLCLAGVPQTSEQPAKSARYDEFMAQPISERLTVFNEVSPENRAELVRTQLTRWLERNASQLNAEQLEVMKENLAFITPERYRLPKKAEDLEQAKALGEKTMKLFTREEVRQALTIHGDYIPPLVKE